MKNIKYILLIIGVFLLDQISKILVTNFLELNDSINIIKGFFSLTYTQNKGAAFGFFNGNIVFIVIVSILVFLYLIYELFKIKKHTTLVNVSLSFLIGGLVGNLVDRIRFGYVRDFLDFNIFGHDYAIFNLSDTFIVVGAVMFLIGTVLEEKNENRSN